MSSLYSNLVESEEGLAAIVRQARVVAVVGMKDERNRHAPAFFVPETLRALGLRVIPVNPKIEEALGERAYPDLASVPERFDVVDIFRRPQYVPDVAYQVLALPSERRPRVVWMQTGIRHPQAAERLAAAGILVVQDQCIKVVATRYLRR
jgi:predicted CoA-binding protein